MKEIMQAYEVLEPEEDVKLNNLKTIERMARICYKSEKSITEDSYKKIIPNLIKNEHYAMLEHSNYVFKLNAADYCDLLKIIESLETVYPASNHDTTFTSYLRFSRCDTKVSRMILNLRARDQNRRYLVSGSLRAWLELFQECEKQVTEFDTTPTVISSAYRTIYELALKDLDIPEGPLMDRACVGFELFDVLRKGTVEEILTHHTLSVIFTTDRGVANELVRHRPASFAQESTRYVNYARADEISFIRPYFFEDASNELAAWRSTCQYAEAAYFRLINDFGCTPQEARSVLPLSTKTEIGITATLSEWQHIINLRYLGNTGKPHPQMEELMTLLIEGDLESRFEGLLDFVDFTRL